MVQETLLTVTDAQLTQSSSMSIYTDASQSRLHARHDRLHSGAWVARLNDDQQWVEISFPRPMTVGGVVTQGRDSTPQWVTQYHLLYSMDGVVYHYYQENSDVPKVNIRGRVRCWVFCQINVMAVWRFL